MADFDADKNGTLSLEEFEKLWLKARFERMVREFQRFDWKGDQPLRLKVVNKVLSLQVGKTAVAKRLELPNYSAGEIAVGTYVTQYGPKPVVFQSLRVRSR